ncbi:MAG: MFS transporter [Chloroflexi bacterium]|nr:MFS transporter [Chloroflexota bacterium]
MPKIFYGWYIVGAGLIINMLIGGLTMNAFGFYAAALKDEFGWSATIFGVAAAVTRVESGLLGPIQGWMIDRFGPRAMIRLGITTTALGMILFGLLWDEISFIGFYILLSIGTSIGGFMTVSVAVVTWFERKRSRAIGFMSMGFTFGALVSAVVGVAILNFGWRETTYATGALLLVVGWGLTFLFTRHPADKGLEVDGGVEAAPDGSAAIARQFNPFRHRDFTAREALRTRAFWGLGLAHGAPLMVVGMWIGHGVLHIDELPGFSAGDAAVVVTVMVVTQLIGQSLSAWAGDRFPKRPLLVLCMIGHAFAGIALAVATGWWMLMAFAVLNGVAWGARGTLITSLRADYFGASQFGRIMGWTSMVMMPFMTIGMLGSGIMRDIFGSYDLAFIIFSIGAGSGVIWILMSTRPRLPGPPRLPIMPPLPPTARMVVATRPNRPAGR